MALETLTFDFDETFFLLGPDFNAASDNSLFDTPLAGEELLSAATKKLDDDEFQDNDEEDDDDEKDEEVDEDDDLDDDDEVEDDEEEEDDEDEDEEYDDEDEDDEDEDVDELQVGRRR